MSPNAPTCIESHLPLDYTSSAKLDPNEWPLNCGYTCRKDVNLRLVRSLVEEQRYRPASVLYIGRRVGLQSLGISDGSLDDTKAKFQTMPEDESAWDERVVVVQSAAMHIGATKECWLWLLDSLKVHPAFVPLISEVNEFTGGFHSYKTFGQDGKIPKAMHIFVKVPSAGHIEASFYLRVDISTKRWTLLLTSDHEAARLHCLQLSNFYNDFDNENHNPFEVLLQLLQNFQGLLYQKNCVYGHQAAVLEVSTGLGSLAYSSSKHTPPDQLDIKRMHWFAGNLRVANCAYRFQNGLATFINSCYSEFIALSNSAVALSPAAKMETERIQEAFARLRTTIEWRERGGQSSMERALAQLDGARMLTDQFIAKRSTDIAEGTRKDSVAMKTIAALTMAFLPATFVATVFSTIFFWIDPQDSRLHVDRHIWIYIVVAAIMTGFTAAAWVWLSIRGVPSSAPLRSLLKKINRSWLLCTVKSTQGNTDAENSAVKVEPVEEKD